MRALLPVPLLVACVPPGHADRSLFDPDLPPPAIVEVEVDCDREAGTWRVDVATDAWAGGAVMLWTLDGTYVERQDGFRSIAAQPDGTGDQLRNDIGVVADFRGVGAGRTAFTCRDTPSAVIWVIDLDRQRSDCVHGGPTPELLLGQEGVPDCPRAWDPQQPGDSDSDRDGDSDSDSDDADVERTDHRDTEAPRTTTESITRIRRDPR